jgi:uncharacterized membrane protein YbhN (UPF0104 family)
VLGSMSGQLTADVAAPVTGGPPLARTKSHGYLRAALGLAVPAAVAVWIVLHGATIDAGGDSLAAADLEWLLVALGLTTVLWVAGTASQLGSLSIRPPLAQLFAVQVAASAVNHVVPGGVGGMAVNMRFLQRSGLSRTAAMAAVGLNSVATLVTHLLLIVAVWSLAPTVLPGGAVQPQLARVTSLLTTSGSRPSPTTIALVAVGATAAVAVVAIAIVAIRRMGLAGAWRLALTHSAAFARRGVQEFAPLGTVLRNPRRAVLLWVGSATSPVLHAVILTAVFKSLATGVPALTLALVYLMASAVSALVPSPGGFGALDVALVAGLIAVGAPSATAVAVVFGYRLVTVWAPLVPGALVFALLLRRRLL